MSEQSEILLPCPFCGSEAEVNYNAAETKWKVNCSSAKCCGSTWEYPTRHQAVEVWEERKARDYLQKTEAPLKLELWYEREGGPQIKTHVSSELAFDDVCEMMIRLRDRLTQEIENGPTCCPFASAEPTDAK